MDCITNNLKRLISAELKDNVINGHFLNDNCDLDNFLNELAKNGYYFSTRSSREYSKETIFCTYTTENITVDLGILFIKNTVKLMDCAHGKKYYELKEDKTLSDHPSYKKQRFHVQSTKKMNCPAFLKLLKITCFPDYKVSCGINWYKKKKEIQRLKQDLIDETKEKLVKKEIRYYFSLSSPSMHNHSTTTTYLNQHIDRSLEKQIQSLVQQGISNVNYIRQHLRDFVVLNYPKVEITSSAFHPSEKIVNNYILKYVNEKQKGLIDQEKVVRMVEDLKKNSNNNIYFRPHHEDEKGNKVPFPMSTLYCKDISFMAYSYIKIAISLRDHYDIKKCRMKNITHQDIDTINLKCQIFHAILQRLIYIDMLTIEYAHRDIAMIYPLNKI